MAVVARGSASLPCSGAVVGLGRYAIMAAGLAAMRRAGDVSPATSRYAALAALLATVVVVWAVTTPAIRRSVPQSGTQPRWGVVLVMALACILVGQAFRKGNAVWTKMASTLGAGRIAETAWLADVPDGQVFRAIYPWEGHDWSPPIFALRNPLIAARHHPFRDPAFLAMAPGNPILPDRERRAPPMPTRVTSVTPVGEHGARINGRVLVPPGAPVEAGWLLAERDGKIVGIGRIDDRHEADIESSRQTGRPWHRRDCDSITPASRGR